jgi:hypothetical protein
VKETCTVQGGLDHRVSGAIITASECTALLAAFVIILSMLGVNVNALLIPAGVALAFAAKDLSHNFLAGGISHVSHVMLVIEAASCSMLDMTRGLHWLEWSIDMKVFLCRLLSFRSAALQAGRQGSCQLLLSNLSQ